jgi:poly(A) polymerase
VGNPARRIEEDRLRILRFFRFHAWFGKGDLDSDGLAACRAGADGIANLSAERVRVEILRLLEAPDPSPIMKIMVEQGVLSNLLAEATRFGRLDRLVKIETELDRVDPVRRLGAILKIDGSSMPEISDRLRLSNAERDRLVALLNCDAALNPSRSDTETRRMQYALGSQLFVNTALLRWAESGDAPNSPAWGAYIHATEQRQQPVFPLRGADVVAAGITAGPKVGALMDQIEKWWIASDFSADRAACLIELDRTVSAARG